MNNRGSWSGSMFSYCASVCGAFLRIFLLLVLIVNLGITSVLVVRFTTINGISIPGATPPGSIIFSEVVAAVSTAYTVVSFCFIGAPLVLLVGDTMFFVAWFAASIILGNSMNETLRFSCQDLAVTLASRASINSGINPSLSLQASTLAQQIFDSCNISKTLFSFHIIATIMFITVAVNAAFAASVGRKRRNPPADQQNNYYNGNQYNGNRGGNYGPAPAVPEIVV